MRRILVTGADGFLGKHLVKFLREEYPNHSIRGIDADLMSFEETFKAVGECHPEIVFHLAGYNGGIQWNSRFPWDIFSRNTIMGLNLLRACEAHAISKICLTVTGCVYSPDPSINPYGLMHEWNALRGEPDPSVACHAYAKRNLIHAANFLRKQNDMKISVVCPSTLYGPGDRYEPERTKVVGAMVKRFVDAKQDGRAGVVCWGDGTVLRDILYVEDCAREMAKVFTKHKSPELMNIPGVEISVGNLAVLIAELVEYKGFIQWDGSMPNGQPRKKLLSSRFGEEVDLISRLKKTIKDYQDYSQQQKEESSDV